MIASIEHGALEEFRRDIISASCDIVSTALHRQHDAGSAPAGTRSDHHANAPRHEGSAENDYGDADHFQVKDQVKFPHPIRSDRRNPSHAASWQRFATCHIRGAEHGD